MTKFNFSNLYFDETPETTVQPNTQGVADFEPAITMDYVTRISDNIATLQAVLGITNMIPMNNGSALKIYKTTVTKAVNQVQPGAVIALSEVERKKVKEVAINLKKYRRLTPAEVIQADSAEVAINYADSRLIGEVRKDVRDSFFTMIAAGEGDGGNGATLQAAASQAWAALQAFYQDQDVTPIYFVNPIDVATYLGSASLPSVVNVWGFTILQGFLGLGTAIVSPSVEQGAVYATAAENLIGVYVPAGGDVATVFGATSDESGLVAMTHTVNAERGSVESLIMTGVTFAPELIDGVFKATIGE